MQVLRIRSKFWGKSMEFQPEGEVRAKYFISQIFCKFLNLDIFNQNSGAIRATIDHFRRIIAWKLWTNLTVCQSLVLAIHLKNFTSGEFETERLGGGVHLEQSHQLPPQPAWCWEVDWHQPQIRNTGFEIQIHNLHAAEIAWHHKYKHQIYAKYKFTTFLHQVGWPLRGEHYLVPILRTFCKDSVCQGFLLEQ